MEVFGAITVETPRFSVLFRGTDGYEIRRYAAYVSIQTRVASAQARQSDGFRALAGFIFGRNQDAETPKPIAMTAPVVSSEGRMAFILPKEYDSVDKVPKPRDSSNVTVHEEPEHDMAVLSYRGDGWSQYDAKLTELQDALKKDGITWVEGSAVLNQFNPPWTLWFLRTNEVGLRLKERFAGKL